MSSQNVHEVFREVPDFSESEIRDILLRESTGESPSFEKLLFLSKSFFAGLPPVQVYSKKSSPIMFDLTYRKSDKNNNFVKVKYTEETNKLKQSNYSFSIKKHLLSVSIKRSKLLEK